jgi:hypothetical protein
MMAGGYFLLEAVSEKLEERAPGSIRAVKSRWKWENSDLAQRIAGTRDKRSRDYRNAMRRVRSAEKRGAMTPEIRRAVQAEARMRGWRRLRRRGTVRFAVTAGEYRVSARIFKIGKYMRFGSDSPIRGSEFAPVVDALQDAENARLAGDDAAAEAALDNANAALEEVLSAAYGMDGGSLAHFTAVDELEITLR